MGILNNLIFELLYSKNPDKYDDSAAEKVLQPRRSELHPTAAETVQSFPSASPETTVIQSDSDDTSNRAATAAQIDEPKQAPFQLTREQMVQGIILAEILGKPVSKRHGFRHNP